METAKWLIRQVEIPVFLLIVKIIGLGLGELVVQGQIRECVSEIPCLA